MLRMLFVVVMAMILMGTNYGLVVGQTYKTHMRCHVVSLVSSSKSLVYLFDIILFEQVELAHGGRGNSSHKDRYSSHSSHSSGRGGRGGGVSRRSDYRGLILVYLCLFVTPFQ